MNRHNVLLAVLVSAVALLGLFAWHSQQIQQTPIADANVYAMDQDLSLEERIIHLPEDGHDYHVSVFVHDDWEKRPDERRLVAWWDADPRLSQVRSQVHFHVYPKSDPIYEERFAQYIQVLPAVVIQDPEGSVWHKESGAAVSRSANELGDRVARIFRRPCPCPQPSPEPVPDPTPTPPVPIPDINIDVGPNVPPQPEFPWLIAVIVVVVCFGGTLLLTLKQEIDSA